MNQGPGGESQRQQQVPVTDAALHQHREDGQRGQREEQPLQMQIAGIEQGDHGDGQQVVDHGQGQQKGPQRRR
jgi:hypothetical protein